MLVKKTYFQKTKKLYSLLLLALLTQNTPLIAATSIGQGIYYDNQQITKLAQKYPARVSKDAGYPLIDNYATLKSQFKGSNFGLVNKPITTGMWWTPLLAVDKPTGQIQESDYLSPLLMIPNPLTVSLSDKGIAMGIPLQNANVDTVHIDRGYTNTLDIIVTTGDLAGKAPLVADYSDWMVTAQWANNNTPLLTANIIEGSPFIFVEKKNNQTTSYLQFTNSQDAKLLSQIKGASLFKTKNASDGIYHYYAYFSNPNRDFSPWKNAAGQIIVPVSKGGNGLVVPATIINTLDLDKYFSLAAIPATSDTEAMDLMNQVQAYAYTQISNTAIAFEYEKQQSEVITHFNFSNQAVYDNSALQKQPLVMLYPWQIKNMTETDKASCLLKDNCASSKGVIKTLKGIMHLYVVPVKTNQTASFSTKVPYRGVLPILPNQLSQAELATIGQYSFAMPADPHLDSKNPWTDTYATGKLLSREAQLIKIADILSKTSSDIKYKSARDTLLKQLKGQVTSFLTGLNYTDACPGDTADCNRPEGSWFYTYNNEWNTMIGFPSGFFTATTLTDHGFHWGYLLDAAATIAQFDKVWAQQYGGMVNLLIRDIYNYKYGEDGNEAIRFPHFRSFDPYSALSSALGMPYSLDNINEEDSAEFMNLAQAVILWGLNTQGLSFVGDSTSPQALLETGLYLYTTEAEGLNHYHFNQNPSSGVFPNGWSNSLTGQTYHLVGNVWGGKQDRSTYFCAGQPCYYQNLASNTMPMTGGSFYLGYDANFVNSAYSQDAKNPCSGDANNSAYCGTLLKYLALGDAAKASQYYSRFFGQQANTPDPGESLPSIYYWIQNLKNIGPLNNNVIADTESFAAFGNGDSLYVAAFNEGVTTKTVHFSSNGSSLCALHSIPPGAIVGTFCNGVEPPIPPVGEFSYMLYLGYPFKPVVVNNGITCPDPATKNPACLLKNIAGPSTMTIAGSDNNFCTLAIAKDGSVTVMSAKSKACNINSQAATSTAPGTINLPAGF